MRRIVPIINKQAMEQVKEALNVDALTEGERQEMIEDIEWRLDHPIDTKEIVDMIESALREYSVSTVEDMRDEKIARYETILSYISGMLYFDDTALQNGKIIL